MHIKKKNIRRFISAFTVLFLTFAAASPIRMQANEYVTDILHEVIVPPGSEYVVVDVLDGVDARYRTMANPDITGDYSCAGFVKRYYSAVYGIDVQNLDLAGPPWPADLFTRVTTPQKGDIIFYAAPPNTNNHSAIVKTFDGQRITLIEQNYKWAQSNSTYTYINRTIPYPPDAADNYEIWRPVFVADEPSTDTHNTSPTPVLPYTPTPSPSPTPSPTPSPFPTPEPTATPTPEPEDGGAVVFSYVAKVMIGRMSINVNGGDIPINAPALLDSDRTIMPVRYVSYAMGLSPDDLKWNEATQTATIYNGNDIIQFTVGSNTIYLNGQPTHMDVPAMLREFNGNGFTYLPVAYLADALGVHYDWDEPTRTATFYKV